jgi:hypothetical protein
MAILSCLLGVLFLLIAIGGACMALSWIAKKTVELLGGALDGAIGLLKRAFEAVDRF